MNPGSPLFQKKISIISIYKTCQSDENFIQSLAILKEKSYKDYFNEKNTGSVAKQNLKKKKKKRIWTSDSLIPYPCFFFLNKYFFNQ